MYNNAVVIENNEENYNIKNLNKNADLILKYNKENTNLEKELENILGSLNNKKEDLETYKNRNWFGKLLNKSEVKWENHAEGVYKGISANFILNRSNTLIIIEIFKILVNQEKKIEENLNRISEISQIQNNSLENFTEKMEAFNNFQKAITRDREESIKQANEIIEKLGNNDAISAELAKVLSDKFIPAIKGNKEKIQGIDTILLELNKSLALLENRNINLENHLVEVKNKGEILEKTISDLSILEKRNSLNIDSLTSKILILEEKIEKTKKINYMSIIVAITILLGTFIKF